MTEPAIFRNAKLKLDRANEHIQEFETRLYAFLKTDFYRLSMEPDARFGEPRYTLQFQATKPIPEGLVAVLGDAIHNLRSVLDYVATALVRSAGGSTAHVNFPVRKTRDELIASMNGGEIKVAGATIIDLIRDVIQPYPRGNGDRIFVLHNLDITDKHIDFIPVVSITALHHVNLTGHMAGAPPGMGNFTMRDVSITVGDDGVMNMITMPGPLEFQGDGIPVFLVMFGEGSPFKGEPVLPTLHQLAEIIAGTVEALEKAYLASR